MTDTLIPRLLDVMVGGSISGALLLTLVCVGGLLPVASRDDRTLMMRVAVRAAGGAVLLYLWLLLLDRLGVPWQRTTLLLPLVVAAAFGLRRIHCTPAIRGGFQRPDRAEIVVLGAFAIFAFLLVRPCLTMPDVVFHWGIKAQRFVLAGGIDYDFLARPWNFNKHADYPNLVPGLYATGAILRGRFSEAIMLPWTLVYAAMIVVAVRERFWRRVGWLRRLDVGGQLTLVVVTLVTLAFAMDYMLGGSPDLLLAGVVALAIPAVLGGADRGRDWQVGVLAALAAGAKYEGGPLAALLVLARLWQRARIGAGIGPRVWLRLGVLPSLVAGAWWWIVLSKGLAQGNRGGSLDLGRWKEIASALGHAIGNPAWHGFAWVMLALPAMLFVRRLRPMAAVIAGQAAVYLFVYFTTPHDVRELIMTSGERLLLHLVPATLVLLGVVLTGSGRPGPGLSRPGLTWPDRGTMTR